MLSPDAAREVNSGTVALVVAIDGDDANAVESIQALRFGEQVSAVRLGGAAGARGDAAAAAAGNGVEEVLRTLDGEIDEINRRIAEREEWVVDVVRGVDPVDGSQFSKTVTTLKGAEDLHARVDALVRRREQILVKCG